MGKAEVEENKFGFLIWMGVTCSVSGPVGNFNFALMLCFELESHFFVG